MSTHTYAPDRAAPAQPFDFRGGASAPRRQLAVLEQLLGLARERAGGSLTTLLRVPITIEHATTELVTYGEYVRSLPTVTSLVEVTLEPLPGRAILEIDPVLALLLVEQLTGGDARPSAPRRLTEVEQALLGEITEPVLASLAQALEAVVPLAPATVRTSVDPRFVDLVPPSETVVLLVMQVTVGEGPSAPAGLLTLCAPAETLAPVLDRLVVEDAEPQVVEPRGPLAGILPDVAVELRVHLAGSPSSLTDIAGLRVGDVLRLDHRTDEPVVGSVGDVVFLTGHLGRRGARLAVQVESVTAPRPAAAAPDPSGHPDQTPPAGFPPAPTPDLGAR